MYLDIKNWKHVTRRILDFDATEYPSILEGSIIKIGDDGAGNPVAIPLVEANLPYGDTGKFAGKLAYVWKGTEEQIDKDVSKIDCVMPGLAIIETDNWDTGDATIVPGDSLTIGWDAVAGKAMFIKQTVGSLAVGEVFQITAENNLVITLK